MKYFGDDYLKFCESLIKILREDIEILGESNDIENIHKIRTSIRKLRGVIKLFNLPKNLDRKLKIFAEKLTYLRDLEVQLDFLSHFPEVAEVRKNKLLLWENEKNITVRDYPPFDTEFFLDTFNKKLKDRYLTGLEIYFNAEQHFKELMITLKNFSLEEDENCNLHIFRIALKKTIYILEAMDLNRESLLPSILELKKFQDILGSIHDMQVFRESIQMGSKDKTIEIERDKLNREVDKKIQSQLVILKNNLSTIPDIIKKIVCLLKKDAIKNFPDSSYKDILISDSDIDFLLSNPQLQLSSAELLSKKFSPDRMHIKRVVEKSHNLLDVLNPLFNFSDEERWLLNISALLHDTGHFFGENNHNIRGKEIIYHSRYLQLDFVSKIKIGWVVESHRGKVKNIEELRLFNKCVRDRIKIVAAILRAADGMEFESIEYIKSYHLELSEKALILYCGKISKELQRRFSNKSQYLSQLIKLPIKIEFLT